MVKKPDKLGLTLLLALCLASIPMNNAFANNTLNQVDVKRDASDGLEFTLYTSSPYADNVVVTKKSDNKYVILMPNVNGASGAKPDFASVRDIVSDVDVRAIDDGQNGYTKLTVITNRPVNIKTNTAKSSPVTQEQREYRALIAQQKTKPSTQIPEQIAQTYQSAPVQKAPAFKLPEIQPTHTAADIAAAASKPAQTVKPVQKQPEAQPKTTKTVKKDTTKPAVANFIDKKIAEVKTDKNIKEVANKVKEQKKVEPKIENIVPKIAQKAPETQPAQAIEEKVSPQTQTEPNVQQPKKNDLSKDISAIFAKIKNKVSGKLPEQIPVTLALILVPIICIIALFNIIRASLRNSQMLKQNFFDNLSRNKKAKMPSEYDNIINNENLSWQEKYQQYVDVSGQNAEPQQDTRLKFVANNKQQTKIVKEAQPRHYKQSNPAQAEFLEQTHETQPEKLERIMQASPSVEKTHIENDIDEMDLSSFIPEETLDETDSIHNEINKTIKLKAFAEKTALEETKRNKKIKHRRIQIELPQEAPHVNLGYSKLHSNPRTFKDANLSVSDLIAKSGKLLNIKTEHKTDKNDYDMISVDEYFNIIGEDKSKVTSPLSDVVANSLASSRKQPAKPKPATNPIEALRQETREDYLSGLIVKSGYNIDNERGFYLVSLDGKSAVIGRSGDEVFVLKKFNKNIDKPLQVRMDNPNVYMVKADDFKSLVEVQKDKMGVLIEL